MVASATGLGGTRAVWTWSVTLVDSGDGETVRTEETAEIAARVALDEPILRIDQSLIPTSTIVQVSLTVANGYGLVSESVGWSVVKGATPKPQVSIAGVRPASRVVQLSQTGQVGLVVLAAAQSSACASDADKQLVWAWQVAPLVGSSVGTALNLTNVTSIGGKTTPKLSVGNAAELVAVDSTADASLSNSYRFTATATSANDGTISATAFVDLEIQPAPISASAINAGYAEISGLSPSSITFNLEGTTSTDWTVSFDCTATISGDAESSSVCALLLPRTTSTNTSTSVTLQLPLDEFAVVDIAGVTLTWTATFTVGGNSNTATASAIRAITPGRPPTVRLAPLLEHTEETADDGTTTTIVLGPKDKIAFMATVDARTSQELAAAEASAAASAGPPFEFEWTIEGSSPFASSSTLLSLISGTSVNVEGNQSTFVVNSDNNAVWRAGADNLAVVVQVKDSLGEGSLKARFRIRQGPLYSG
eukprot:GABV01000105.1.p1 GENE.GABV01000105.1~~GABV01000105.1.p1  ORF type:complete len:479 (-),score=187.76 GABV01000105.1:258-1694(-)